MKPASVFVGGLGDDLSREDLEKEFSKYGKLNSIWVAQNPPGFAFIEYDDSEDADEAIKEMNGAVINGSQIRVEMSRGRRGGRGGGGWRDGRGGGRGFRGGRDGGYRGRGSYGSSRGSYDSGYGGSSRFSSGGGRGRGMSNSRYGGSSDRGYSYDSPSYGGGDDYSSSSYRSRSPVGNRKMKEGIYYTDDVPFSCCNIHLMYPCISERVHEDKTHFRYDYTVNLTLYTGGCRDALMKFYGRVMFRRVGLFIFFILILQVAMVTMTRYMQTAFCSLTDGDEPTVGWLITWGADIAEGGDDKSSTGSETLETDVTTEEEEEAEAEYTED